MFGNNIKKLREKKGLSQKKLAEEIGVTQQSLSKWEQNKTRPDYEILLNLSKIFNVSTDYILNNEMVFDEDEKIIILKNWLIKKGYMEKDDDLTEEELEVIMKHYQQIKKMYKGE